MLADVYVYSFITLLIKQLQLVVGEEYLIRAVHSSSFRFFYNNKER